MAGLGKFAAVLLWIPILIWVAVDALLRLIVAPRPVKFEPGVTFSPLQANILGLDWKDTYRAILDDLGVKRLRLPAYWTELEPERGKFDFSQLDFLVNEAEKRSAKIVLAVGQKLPRWPECHIPEWAQKLPITNYQLPNSEFELALLTYIRAVVEHYKDVAAIEMWQVENEPFFKFGECPEISFAQVKKEVDLVRSLDKRPIIITDSGELGTWFNAARLADVLGTTMYRITWKRGFGYLHYFLPAEFYEKKAMLAKKLFGKSVWVMEMQLEPWVPAPPISNHPLEEQMRSMSFEQFKSNIAYARASRLSPIYFWGAEWWYWMKLNGHPEFWNYVRDNVFQP
jgi:hypothetical protein